MILHSPAADAGPAVTFAELPDAGERFEPVVALACDATLHLARLGPGAEAAWEVPVGRAAYLCMVGGVVRVDGTRLAAGSRIVRRAPGEVRLRAVADAEVYLLDVRC